MTIPIPEDTLPILDDKPPSPLTGASQEFMVNEKSKGKGLATEPSDDEASPPDSFEASRSSFSSRPELLPDLPPSVSQPNLTCQSKAQGQKTPSKPKFQDWARLFRNEHFLSLLVSALQKAGVEIPEPDGFIDECPIGFEADSDRFRYPDNPRQFSQYIDEMVKRDRMSQHYSHITFPGRGAGEGTAERSSDDYSDHVGDTRHWERAGGFGGLSLWGDTHMKVESQDPPSASGCEDGPVSKTADEDIKRGEGMVMYGPPTARENALQKMCQRFSKPQRPSSVPETDEWWRDSYLRYLRRQQVKNPRWYRRAAWKISDGWRSICG